jgi:hypothetical protein
MGKTPAAWATPCTSVALRTAPAIKSVRTRIPMFVDPSTFLVANADQRW